MSRTVEEWIGDTDDTPIPPRVKVRLFEAAGGQCANCGVSIRPGNGPQYDHVKSLINGGKNRETNLQVLCTPCHTQKTKADVAEKSAVYAKKAKHIGAKTKRPWHPNFKRRMDGKVVDKRTGKII